LCYHGRYFHGKKQARMNRVSLSDGRMLLLLLFQQDDHCASSFVLLFWLCRTAHLAGNRPSASSPGGTVSLVEQQQDHRRYRCPPRKRK
jgi:hypothetical protein